MGFFTAQYEKVTSGYIQYFGNGAVDAEGKDYFVQEMDFTQPNVYAESPFIPPEGQYFLGWSPQKNVSYADSGFFLPGAPVTHTESTILYAIWGQNRVTYHYKWNPSASAYQTEVTYNQTVWYGQGNAFSGWNTEPDGTGDWYRQGTTLPGGTVLELYAQYFDSSDSAYFYIMTNPAPSGPDYISIPMSAATELVTPPGDAPYGFYINRHPGEGWQDEMEAAQELLDPPFSVNSGDRVISYDPDWVIHYDKNTGDGTPQRTHFTIVSSSAYLHPLRSVEEAFGVSAAGEDRVFAGWNTKSNGSGETVTNQTPFSREGGEMTLYAQWSKYLLSMIYTATGDLAGDNWTWDYDRRLLTLSGVNETLPADTSVRLPENTTIVLTEGTENYITGSTGIGQHAIIAHGALTIQGTGSLHLLGGASTYSSHGLYVEGKLRIQNATVKATGGTAGDDSCGIFARHSIDLENATLTAAGGKAGICSYGLYLDLMGEYQNGGVYEGGWIHGQNSSITAVGGGESFRSRGICANALDFRACWVEAIASDAEQVSCAVDVDTHASLADSGNLYLRESSTLHARCGSSSAPYYIDTAIEASGLYVEQSNLTTADGHRSMAITCKKLEAHKNAVVTATGGAVFSTNPDAYIQSIGLRASEVDIRDGSVTATSGRTSIPTIPEQGSWAESTGLYAKRSVTVTGGELTAEGHTYGLVGGDLTIRSGSVTASAASGSRTPCAVELRYTEVWEGDNLISSYGGNLTMQGGTLTASAEGANAADRWDSVTGIHCTSLYLSGGTVNTSAEGGVWSCGIFAETDVDWENKTATGGLLSVKAGGLVTATGSRHAVSGKNLKVLVPAMASEDISGANAEPFDPDRWEDYPFFQTEEGLVAILEIKDGTLSGGQAPYLVADEDGYVTLPETAYLPGYLFDGWYLDGERVEGTIHLTQSVIIEALWVKDPNYIPSDETPDEPPFPFLPPVMDESSFTAPPMASFLDVPLTAYYCDAVIWAVSRGITNGTGEAIFSPDATCSRAQIVTFLWRALG